MACAWRKGKEFGIGAVPGRRPWFIYCFFRLWGSPLLGIVVMNWMARNAEPFFARNAIILGNIVGFTGIAVLDAWGSFSGGRPVTKIFVFVHLIFTVAFIWIGRKNIIKKTD